MSALLRGAVTPLKGAAAAAIAWRTQGRHYVTVIAKASFAFAIDAVMWRTDQHASQGARGAERRHPRGLRLVVLPGGARGPADHIPARR
ncbi:hypothetical protein WME95_18455 [Sorangium sp. So ce327]|jgi:hypothetical protein|uniref:hypothetical protein n=1 Tax=Sorangium sp. So ce327 TaxID=3133301 RepID=UPI003F60A382